MRRLRNGFTVIELMVVLAVLAVIVSLAMSLFASLEEKRQQQIAKEIEDYWTAERVNEVLLSNVWIQAGGTTGHMPNCEWTNEFQRLWEQANPEMKMFDLTPNSASSRLQLPNLPKFALSDDPANGTKFLGFESNAVMDRVPDYLQVVRWELTPCEREGTPTTIFRICKRD